MPFLSVLSISFFLAAAARADCECGYRTNTGDVWQYAIETDFDRLSDADFRVSSDWVIDVVQRQPASRNAYSLNYTAANVNVNDSILALTCSAYNQSSNTRTINAAQVSTTRNDIKYGSFRSRHKMDGSPGAVGAIFFYASDTQEVDIELLTRDPVQNVHFTDQPDYTVSTYMPNLIDRTIYANYRFDWLPSESRFYINDCPSANFTDDVPNVNGTIKLNSWGNGGPFSGETVPSQDAVMSVQNIQLYFNTSDDDAVRNWRKVCRRARTPPCSVDSEDLTYNKTAKAKSHQTQRAGANRLKVPLWSS